MIICEIFQEEVTNLTPEQMKMRCGRCLEKSPGEVCKWLNVVAEIEEAAELESTENKTSDDIS